MGPLVKIINPPFISCAICMRCSSIKILSGQRIMKHKAIVFSISFTVCIGDEYVRYISTMSRGLRIVLSSPCRLYNVTYSTRKKDSFFVPNIPLKV